MEYTYTPKTTNWILGILLAITFLFSGIQCSRHKTEMKTSRHNIEVLLDSVAYLELKNGDQVAIINSYILEKKELQDYLDISKQEIRDLERKLGKLSYLSNIESSILYDTIVIHDTVSVKSDTTYIPIHYNDDWLTLQGLSLLNDGTVVTTLNKVEMQCPLRVGLTNEYRIWVEPRNPYMKVTDIEGAVIDGSKLHDRKKHWNIGIQAGFGAQYGMMHGFDVGPYIGVDISGGWDF